MRFLQRLVLLFISITFFAACSGSKNTPAPVVQPINITADATVTSISASSGVTGSTLIITGTNFGTTISAVKVWLKDNGGISIAATVLSVTNTQITIAVPASKRGIVVVRIDSQQEIKGPAFFNTSPYVTGDVQLSSQQDVDDFVANNKNNSAVQISGRLYISGNDIISLSGLNSITSINGPNTVEGLYINCPALTNADFLATLTSVNFIDVENSPIQTISFARVKNFAGNLYLRNLSKLTTVDLSSFNNVRALTISDCPMLTDLNSLSNLATALSDVSIGNCGVSSISMDNLTSITGQLIIANLPNLKSLTAKSLASVSWNFTLRDCPIVSTLNFNSISTIKGRLMLNNFPIVDLTNFKTLQSLGALNITGNANFASFKGLEKITALTASTNTNADYGGPTNNTDNLNGLIILNNPVVTSMAGLQNLTGVTLVNISGNATLNDLCPIKSPLLTLSASPIANYNNPGTVSTVYLLTLKNNGNLITQQNALDALTACK